MKIKNLGASLKAKVQNVFRKSAKDQRGQGMTEYALLLLVIVAMVVIFKDQIKGALNTKLGEVAGSITGFSAE